MSDSIATINPNNGHEGSPISALEVQDTAAPVIAAIDRGLERLEELGLSDTSEATELAELRSNAQLGGAAVTARIERYSSPYEPSESLRRVVRLAQILNKPILLEGEPGTGKTSLAYALAAEHGHPVIHLRGKSTLTAESVMYEIDHLSRLNDAQLSQNIPEHLREQAERWTNYLKEGGSANDASFRAFMDSFDNSARLLN